MVTLEYEISNSIRLKSSVQNSDFSVAGSNKVDSELMIVAVVDTDDVMCVVSWLGAGISPVGVPSLQYGCFLPSRLRFVYPTFRVSGTIWFDCPK